MSDASKKPQSQELGYAHPARGASGRTVNPVVAFVAIVFGIFGAVMFYYGLDGVAMVLEGRRGNRPESLAECGIFIITGAVCAALAARWVRVAFRGRE